MELITLGTSAAYPTVDRACSGFLIRQDDTSILLEAGSGVTRNLFRWMDPALLDAIIVTHLHQDHFIDLFPLFYYLVFEKRERFPIDVYAPEGLRRLLLSVLPEGSESELDGVYRIRELEERKAFGVKMLECQAIMVPHSLPAFGMRVSGDGIVAYSSDTDYDEVIVDVAKGSDIFICEATMQKDLANLKHLTAAQAGIIARKAGAKKLVLTHIWPDFDPAEQQLAAAAEYDGPIVVAEDNMRIVLA